MSNSSAPHNQTLSRGSYSESSRVAEILRQETVGGFILLVATVLAVILANSPAADFYFGVRDAEVGAHVPGFHHLMMTVSEWAADGLLVVFFFLTGLELKKEFVVGDLHDPGKAIVPIAAAFGGVAVPALIFAAINFSNPSALHGWAIPTATDIAFAVAVISAVGTALPSALRIFLLTLAVVDDLIAIFIIAIFYTTGFKLTYLLLALIPIALFWLIAHKGETMFHLKPLASWLILLPLGIITWALFLESGIHATISGVILGFCVPVVYNKKSRAADAPAGLAEVLEHRLRPLSTGFCVPVFAFFSAGVAMGGFSGLAKALTDSVALGIMLGLVLGKTIGITLTTWLVTRFRKANLDPDIAWVDVIGLAMTAGIGFTVSLLVAELSFGPGSEHTENAKIAILVGSVSAAILGSLVLSRRNKHYKELAEKESLDSDEDGIPDVFTDNGSRLGGGAKRAD